MVTFKLVYLVDTYSLLRHHHTLRPVAHKVFMVNRTELIYQTSKWKEHGIDLLHFFKYAANWTFPECIREPQTSLVNRKLFTRPMWSRYVIHHLCSHQEALKVNLKSNHLLASLFDLHRGSGWCTVFQMKYRFSSPILMQICCFSDAFGFKIMWVKQASVQDTGVLPLSKAYLHGACFVHSSIVVLEQVFGVLFIF